MAFDPTFRVLIESSTDNLNTQIVAELHKLDEKAAEIRERGGSPQGELAGEVAALRSSIERATLATVQAINGELDAVRQVWEKARDKNPTAELAAFMRAQSRIRGLSDAEAAKLAVDYANEQADLSLPELNELRGRLRQTGAEAEMLALGDAVEARRGAEPWISQDPEAASLVDYRDKLSGLRGGQVLYDGDQGQAVFEVADLVDYSGELSVPVAG